MPEHFHSAFKHLTGHSPFEWQVGLYERLCEGNIPTACDLPTGTGKTSVIPIWLLALAQSEELTPIVPRRLVYVVNRRTVVDQSTTVVMGLRERLSASELRRVRNGLAQLSASLSNDGLPIAISTLRGELADNGQWRLDPTLPAIVIGTVDMIGSKLLFQGYGDGRYFRAHHAGLFGGDTLFVHDESHLSPAFGELLKSVARFQQLEAKQAMRILPPIRVMDLSATATATAGQSDKPRTVIRLGDDLKKNSLIDQRVRSTKRLKLTAVDTAAAVEKGIVEFVRKHVDKPVRILVYVQTPALAQKIVQQLTGGKKPVLHNDQVATLTGTMRGHERDAFAESDIVRWFAGDAPLKKPVVIVSTSAGEVGVDWDADHSVMDLTSLESMIQRMGRVNRNGGRNRVANVEVLGK